MFISHPYLLSANWSPAAPSTPVVFNWQIDSAVCKPGHLQKTPDWLGVKCHRVTQHQVDRNVALWPDVPRVEHKLSDKRSITCLNNVNCRKDEHVPCAVSREQSESPRLTRSYVISAELRSECVSSAAQKSKFNRLLTCVYSGQRER